MPFVKLDCGILNSTIWYDKPARDVFITALLMATPREFDEPAPAIKIRSLDRDGWDVPPGWYGFVPAAGIGIVHRAGVEQEAGLEALERLSSPEPDSRSKDFEGRRLARINGGFVVLNYMRYRKRDETGAERTRRWRARQKEQEEAASRRVTPSPRRVTVTQAEDRDQRSEAEKHVSDANASSWVLAKLNLASGRSFRKPSAPMKARIKEYGVDACILVIEYLATRSWWQESGRLNTNGPFGAGKFPDKLAEAEHWDKAGRPAERHANPKTDQAQSAIQRWAAKHRGDDAKPAKGRVIDAES